MGEEASGAVEAVDEGITDVKEGDRVFFKAVHKQQVCYLPTALFQRISYAQQPEGLGHLAPWVEGGDGQYAGQPILIVGGTSSVGQYAIQLATLSGFSPIITIAPLHNAPFLARRHPSARL